jgi:hypothetical protein
VIYILVSITDAITSRAPITVLTLILSLKNTISDITVSGIPIAYESVNNSADER